MSMIRCNGCDRVGDCKDEWIDGLFEDAKPYRFWCPACAGDPNNNTAMTVLRNQDPDRYHELMDDEAFDSSVDRAIDRKKLGYE